MHKAYATPLVAILLGTALHAQAQQPFERLGVKVKILSLSNGRYPEYFANDSLRRIGSIVYDTRLRRIAYLLPPDSLTGRMKSEVTSRWLSVDPLAEKFAHITPYAFVSNNPIRFNDPDGRAEKDVILGGSQKSAAFQQLQSSVQGSLNLSMDNSGKVAYTQTSPFQSADAKQLMTAIDDHSVTVKVTAENTKMTSTGNLYIGGAFMGNTVSKMNAPISSNVVETKQEINPQVLGAMDGYYNKPGQSTLHEVVESYLGGATSQQTGTASGMAGQPSSNYPSAHNGAPAQSGQVNEVVYDKYNNVVPNNSPAANRIEYNVQSGSQPAQTIMTYP